MNDTEIHLLYDEATIRNGVEEIGVQLEADLGDSDPLLISVVGGSVLFMADLVRAIHKPIQYEFIQVQYSAASLDDTVMEIHYPISMDVVDRSLVVVKDVVTTGVIESYLRSQFLQRRAKSVSIVR